MQTFKELKYTITVYIQYFQSVEVENIDDTAPGTGRNLSSVVSFQK